MCYFNHPKRYNMGNTLTYEYVKTYIEGIGYKLLSTEYTHSKHKLSFQCRVSHTFSMKFNDFQQGQRCPLCSCHAKLTYKHVENQIKQNGYTLLSKEYNNMLIPLLIKCPKGHQFKMRYGNFTQGQKCPVCFGTPKHTYRYIKEYFEKEKYILLSTEYTNALTKMDVQCPKNHIYRVSFNGFQYGYRCSKCAVEEGGSIPEKEILSYIQTSYKGTVIPNDRKTIYNHFTKKWLELDIYLPELKKAIEYGSRYYHRNDITKWRDEIKKKRCKKLGIDLLVLWYEEWDKDYSMIDNFINERIGVEI